MYNHGNMRLHVDLFIKYISNNVYSDNNHGQPQSILNIFLTFFSSLYFMTTFCGLFSVWYWYHCFFLLGGMKMNGSAGLFNKKNIFLPRRELKGGRSGTWETQRKYGHPYTASWGWYWAKAKSRSQNFQVVASHKWFNIWYRSFSRSNMDLCDIWINISETVHARTNLSMKHIYEVTVISFPKPDRFSVSAPQRTTCVWLCRVWNKQGARRFIYRRSWSPTLSSGCGGPIGSMSS